MIKLQKCEVFAFETLERANEFALKWEKEKKCITEVNRETSTVYLLKNGFRKEMYIVNCYWFSKTHNY